MIFIDNKGNYPKYIEDLREVYPEWTYKNAIPSSWKIVRPTTPPEVSGLEMLVEEFPEDVNGTFVQKWSVQMMPNEVLDVELPETSMERFSTDPKHSV